MTTNKTECENDQNIHMNQNKKPIIIGCSGLARAGKDTFVKVAMDIVNKNGYSSTKVAFADSLKEEVKQMLKDSYFNLNVNTEDTEKKKQIRPLLVWWGCTRRNLGNGFYWIDKVEEKVNNLKEDVIFVSDCRFPNEADWLHEKWGGWFVHLKKYSILSGMQYDSFTGKESGVREWKQYDEAPNVEEATNDPLCEQKADFRLELENAIERELRLTGNKITPESLVDNSYLINEITTCLSQCPSLIIQNPSKAKYLWSNALSQTKIDCSEIP